MTDEVYQFRDQDIRSIEAEDVSEGDPIVMKVFALREIIDNLIVV